MLRIILGVLLLLIIPIQNSFSKAPPPGTGFLDVPTNVLIMLDRSTSMNADIFSGSARYPNNIAFESDDDFFVARYSDSMIEKYDSSGSYMMDWGEYGTDNSQFDNIFDLDVDSGDNLYVADKGNGRVQKFSTMGVFISSINVSTAEVKGLTVNGTSLYVLNQNGTVEKYNTNTGAFIATWGNTGGYMLADDTSGNIYVTNYAGKVIEKYDSNGNLLLSFPTRKSASGSPTTFNPYGIEVDSTGAIYVSDSTGAKIYEYNAAGTVVANYAPTGSSKFFEPRGIAKKVADDSIWITDFSKSTVRDLTGTELFSIASHETRLDQAKRVVKDLVTNSELTDGANFGLISFSSSATLNVPISSTGAATIYTTIDSLTATGGVKDMDGAMSLAESYLTGASSPMTSGAWCQDDLIVVISDGFFNDTTTSATAANLYTNYDVKTFPVGFLVSASNSAAANYITLATAGGTYPDGPVFADNWQQLYSAVTDYILSVVNSNMTFSTPTIMPEVTGTDHIVQATFKYKTTHQWKGHLNKYTLDSSGGVGALEWDAGVELAAVAAADRQIWTVNTGLPTGLNNFVTANIDDLRVPLLENSGVALTDSELTTLIDFVRGVDSYGEFSGGVDDEGDTIIAGERWKLSDVYHSRSVVVGAPSAFTSEDSDTKTESYYRFANGYNGFKTGSAGSRDAMVYVGSNGGMLHAFKSDDGSELWAFIPPSIIPNFAEMISSTASQSNSIYGVDGSPVVKDIFYGGAWHTILMSGARQGGHTYFALDVTDPTAPTHLFTFTHNKLNSVVSYWDSTGTRTDYSTASAITAEYDFSTLGESWSKPVILRLPVGTSGAMKWTAVFGGGFNAGINPNYGGQLYIIDMEDGGKIINNLTISDDDATNGIVVSAPERVMPITPDSSTFFQGSTDPSGAVIYFSDLEGKLWKINLTDQGTLYETSKLFDTEATNSNTRYTFHENAATVDTSGNLWQYYGTGDQQSLGDVNSNIANRAYGVKHTPAMTDFSTVTMSTISNMADVAAGVCPTTSQDGWYIDLDSNEKVTAKATVSNSAVYFSRYTPDATNICSSGSAKVSEHSYTCGTLIAEFDLGFGVPTETILHKNKIYLGISTDQAAPSLPPGWVKDGNLIIGTPTNEATGNVTIESWWEDF